MNAKKPVPKPAKKLPGNKIIHDAEYYVLDAQHGEKWAAEDKGLDAKLEIGRAHV